jgi:hypothetical protein
MVNVTSGHEVGLELAHGSTLRAFDAGATASDEAIDCKRAAAHRENVGRIDLLPVLVLATESGRTFPLREL